MSVIDKTTHTLKCQECGISESTSVLDKGSEWSNSSWQSGPLFSDFTVEWSSEGGKIEPRITSATCKSCNISANVSIS